MEKILTFSNFVGEALGVPQNLIPLAKQVFDFFVNNIDESLSFQELVQDYITMTGNFKISDMVVNEISIAFKFRVLKRQYVKKGDEHLISFYSMQSHFQSAAGPYKTKKNKFLVKSVPGKELFISIDLEITDDVEGLHLKNFFNSQRTYFIPIIAHELKHFYDKFKNPDKNIESWVDYSTATKAAPPILNCLTDFCQLSYYLHDFENLVRPTEFATMLDIEEIGEEKFKDYFEKSDIYQFLKMGREFSLENLRKDLLKEKVGMFAFIMRFGNVNPLHLKPNELVELVLQKFYEMLIVTRAKSMEQMLYPTGKVPFRFMGKKELYFDKYLEKVLKFGNDYEAFFKHEEEYINNQAEKMFRKLSGLYAMTDIYGKKQNQTNIWKH